LNKKDARQHNRAICTPPPCGAVVFLAAAAKTRFSALVDEAVATHEQITVTRNGEPAVVPTASGIDLTTRP
jgi:hypothetical protein